MAFQSIAFSSSIERKNIIQAIKIFVSAFNSQNNAKYIIRYAGEAQFPKSFKNLIKISKKFQDKIILVKSNGQEHELFEFYSASDIYLSLHRSEGFGLNIAEAMLVGLPISCTNWSGNLEFCNQENSCLVDFELSEVFDSKHIYNSGEGFWAEPKKTDAIKKLQLLANDIMLQAKPFANSKKTYYRKF